ncbi:hypothetical protein HRbin09_00261 [bacterium HR09]|nr:hypothetical protein HRbin09_00261 [bacterium HR09]
MVLMHVYSLRKRLPALSWLGDLRGFLNVHIYLGILGCIFITLHSAGKVGGLVGIAFWSMVTVALSGLFGRFLYAQIPRTASGDQLSLEEATQLVERLQSELASDTGMGLPDFRLRADPPNPNSLLVELFCLFVLPIKARLLFRRKVVALSPAQRAKGRELVETWIAVEVLRRRIFLWRQLHDLFHYWHVFHKPLALLMYLFAFVHLVVVYSTGYLK